MQGAGVRIPGPPEFTEAIGLWIKENYTQVKVETYPKIGDIVLTPETEVHAKVGVLVYEGPPTIIHCHYNGCRIHNIRLAYEHPEFFDHLAKILDHIISGAPIHTLNPEWHLEEDKSFRNQRCVFEASKESKPFFEKHLWSYYGEPEMRNRGPPLC